MKAYAIEALNDYFDDIADKEKIIGFVKAQLVSDSPKTRKTAKVFFGEAGCEVNDEVRNIYLKALGTANK